MKEIWLSLHNIRSTYNVGSLFRTAEGFGVKKIIFSGYTPYPKKENDTRLPHIADKIHKQIAKTSLGAENEIDFINFNTIDEVLQFARQQGLKTVALEQAENSQNITNFNYTHPMLLLLGEEVHGIDKSTLSKVDTIIEIPMVGKKESFNVSVAGAIALYQIFLK